MLRYCLVFLLLFLVQTGTLKAQRFHGGAMGGMVISTVTGDGDGGWKKIGPFVGAYVMLDIGQRSSIQLEIEYFQKGARDNPNVAQGKTSSYIRRMGYIEMPLLFKYQFTEWFGLETGPSLGFLVHQYEEIDGYSQDFEPPLNNITYQWNIGMNFRISKNFTFNIRSNNSLVNIRKETTTGYVRRFGQYGQYNDAFVLSVFYRFIKLGKE